MKKTATAVACVAAVVGGAVPPSSSSLTSSSLLPTSESRIPSCSDTTTTTLRGGAAHDDHKNDVEQKKGKKKRKQSKKAKPATEKVSKEKEEDAESAPSTEKKSSSGTAETSSTSHRRSTPSSTHKHAMHHHSRHQDKVVKQILQDTDYYAILGVSKTAASNQIQKAYRRRCVLTHPDKMESGDRTAFDKVAEAFDVLSDDEKRRIYDQYGKVGLEAGGGRSPSAFSAEDILRSFFGVGGRSAQPSQPRNRTVRYQLEVSLEDLYKGMTRTVIVTQPGSAERKRVEVHVEAGMANGQAITLSGEMDSIQDATPADLVFLLAQRRHPVFTRKGHDLAVELKISLQEAICGVSYSFTHLDGRVVNIVSARRSSNDDDEPVLIQTGDVQVLKGEGMPKHVDNSDGGTENNEHGDLYVQYKVEMPSTSASQNRLSPMERKELGRLLAKLEGKREQTNSENTENVCVLQKAMASDFGRASGPFRMDRNDSDPHLQEDGEHERPTFPFGTKSFQYYSSGGGNPFFNRGANQFTDDDDDSNVHCQQM